MGTTLKALILENEPTDAELIAHKLQRSGYDLDWHRVENKHELEARLDFDLDIIFLDTDVPDFKGLQALDVLAEAGLDIPVIVVTDAIEEAALECMRRGAVDYLLKDRMARLGSAVRTALEERRNREDRAGAIEALRASEQRYRGVAETALAGITIVDAEDQFTYTNPAFADMLGYSLKELLGMSFHQIVHPDEIRKIQTQRIQLAKGERLVYETIFRRKDGESRNVIVSASALTNEYGEYEGSQAVITDITERVRAEDRFKIIFESAPDPYYLSDLNGRFVDGNKAAERIIDYSREELIGKSFLTLDVLPEKQQQRAAALLAENALGKPTGPDEFTLIRKEGDQVEVEIASQPVNIENESLILGIARDITERKQAQEALRESEEQFRAVVENSHNGIIVVGEDFKAEYVNDQLCIVLGRSREEIVGHDFRKFLDKKSEEIVSDRYKRRQQGEAVPSRYEFNILRKDGERRMVEISSAIVDDSSGKARTIAQIMDITDRKLAEKDLQQSLEEAARSKEILLALSQAAETVQRVRSKTEIFQSVGSEIKKLGFEASILLTTEDHSALKIEFITFDSQKIRKVERLTGFTQEGFRIPLTKGTPYFDILMKKEAAYIDAFDDVTAYMFPKALQPFARKIASTLGFGRTIHAPLLSTGKSVGLLVVTGESLRSEDVPAITTFANQVANALESTQLLFSLHQSEERFRGIFEGVQDAILVEGLNGEILDANSSACRMYRCELSDLVGKNVSELVPEGNEVVLPSKTSNGGLPTTPVEAINIRADGEHFPVEITARLQELGDETVMLVVVRDITERVAANQQIQLLKEFNENIVHSIIEGIVVQDHDGLITFVNPAAAHMHGYSIKEFEGLHFTEIIPPDQQDIVRTHDEGRRRGLSSSYELEVLHKNGHRITVLVSGSPRFDEEGKFAGTLAVFTDLTEQMKKHEALEESEARFSAVVESATDAIVTIDAKGEIHFWNSAAGKIFGYSEEEVRGKSVGILIPERLREAHENGMSRLASTGTPKIIGEVVEQVGMRKGGEEFPLELSLSTWDINESTFYTALIRDITERKRTDRRVSQFSRIIEDSLNEIFLFETETLKFTQVNTAAQDNLGYTLEDLREMTPLDIKPEFTTDTFDDLIAPLRNGETREIVFETVHKRKDQSLYYVEAHIQLLKHEHETLFAAIILDITARKKIELKIRRQIEQLEALRQIDLAITSLPNVEQTLEVFLENLMEQLEVDAATILLYDPEGDKLECASRRGFRTEALRFTSLSPGSGFAGKVARNRKAISFSDLKHENGDFNASPEIELEEFSFYYCTPLIAHDQVQGVIELFHRSPKHPDAEWVNFLEMLATQAAIAIVNNSMYTQLVEHSVELEVAVEKATEDLHQSLNRQNAILNNSPDAILLLNDKGIIAQANRAVSELLGYRPDELESTALEMLLDPDVEIDLAKELAQLTESTDFMRSEIPAVKNDGSSFDAEVILTPIKDTVSPRAFVCTIRDMSAWTKLQRLKDAFVSNVSHELRTPIASLRLNYSLLRRDPDNADRYLERFDREIERLNQLIEDMLRLSRLDSGRVDLELAPVDLNKLVKNTVHDRTPIAEMREHVLEVHISPEAPIIQADPNLLGQVLSVLLTNAIAYTPKGGYIEIGVVHREDDDESWCGFYVEDDGPGIADEDLSLLFDRFFRGKVGRDSGAPGTGLGLAIADEILTRHEGFMDVETGAKDGRGARFTAMIPANVRRNIDDERMKE